MAYLALLTVSLLTELQQSKQNGKKCFEVSRHKIPLRYLFSQVRSVPLYAKLCIKFENPLYPHSCNSYMKNWSVHHLVKQDQKNGLIPGWLCTYAHCCENDLS